MIIVMAIRDICQFVGRVVAVFKVLGASPPAVGVATFRGSLTLRAAHRYLWPWNIRCAIPGPQVAPYSRLARAHVAVKQGLCKPNP